MKLIIALFFLGYLTDYSLGSGPLDYVDFSKWGGECPTGRFQSPIDIPAKDQLITSKDIFTIKSTQYNPISGPTLEIHSEYKYMLDALESKSSLLVNFTGIEYKYNLNDIHFHVKSEHTIEGKAIDIEMHMVHKKDADYISSLKTDPDERNKIMVVGIMFKGSIEGDNPFISSLDFENKKPVSNVNLEPFVNANKAYYYYQGSLTTPECTETVHWVVMKEIELISDRQLMLINEWIKDKYKDGNARETHLLNGRVVYYVENNSDIIAPNKMICGLLLLLFLFI